jgi:transcriptional regulator with XRE-family HTH domain
MLQFIKLGNIIKEIRQKRGIDEKAMAKQINVSVSRYREIENGNAIYNFSTLIKIANILEVDLPEIFKKW